MRSYERRTVSWFDEIDRAALAKVRERDGIETDNSAIWLIVRLLAESQRINVAPIATGSDEKNS
jgi:hypothetical protein